MKAVNVSITTSAVKEISPLAVTMATQYIFN
jgi:hypothetical protein